MKDSQARRQAIAEAAHELREFSGTTLSRLFIALLDAVSDDLLAELATVTPEKLLFKQGQLAQTRVLRDLLTGSEPAPPSTTF